MNCGEKIADLRKKRGMTQDELGKTMNVSYQAVSKWERDESMPDFDTMSKIAKFFNVPLAYFEEDGDLKQNEPYREEPHGNAIGICTVCGRMLKEGEEEKTYPKIVCKSCADRERSEAQHAAALAEQSVRTAREADAREVIGHGFDATLVVSLVLAAAAYIGLAVLNFLNLSSSDLGLYGAILFLFPMIVFGTAHSVAGTIAEFKDGGDESGYRLGLSLLSAAGFAIVHTAIFLALYLSIDTDESFIFLFYLIGGAVLSFTFVSQFLWGGAIKDVFTAGGFTFKIPGFIITLEMESVLWMLVTKFFLGIAAAIIFVITTVAVAAIAVLGSVFFFITCLLLKLARDRKAKQYVTQ